MSNGKAAHIKRWPCPLPSLDAWHQLPHPPTTHPLWSSVFGMDRQQRATRRALISVPMPTVLSHLTSCGAAVRVGDGRVREPKLLDRSTACRTICCMRPFTGFKDTALAQITSGSNLLVISAQLTPHPAIATRRRLHTVGSSISRSTHTNPSPAFVPALRHVAYHTSCRPSQRRHPASNSRRRRSHYTTWRPTHRFAKHPDPRDRVRHSRCRTVGSRYACHADAWTSSLRAPLCEPVATSGLLGAQCLSGVLLLGAFALVLPS